MQIIFRSPDPDRLHRLFWRWDHRLHWTLQNQKDLEDLARDWLAYYRRFENETEAKALEKRMRSVRKELACLKPQMTPSGAVFVRPKRKSRGTEL